MTSSNIIPFPPARNPSQACHLGSGAACQPAAASYSPIGNPSFDPVAFNEALYERELDAVREVMK